MIESADVFISAVIASVDVVMFGTRKFVNTFGWSIVAISGEKAVDIGCSLVRTSGGLAVDVGCSL